MHYRFRFRSEKSPTYSNLQRYLQEKNWKSTLFTRFAHFHEGHFQFDEQVAQQLEYKHLLAQLVATYCPEVMPETYYINDTNWPLIINELTPLFYANPHQVWILKPALLNNGQHIKIFQTLSAIEMHFQTTNRMGGDHVLQRYITPPHLLQGPTKGHKYSIRMFVVLTNYAGAFLYPQGYFNIGLQPYQEEDFTDTRAHLTNEHLQEHERNVVQIPTQQYAFFESLYPQIQNSVAKVMHGLEQMYPHAFTEKNLPRCAIFGFDFMADAEERLWLLEANHAPCFPVSDSHPIQQTVYHPFWQAFITNFVIPIANKQQQQKLEYEPFEAVGKYSYF